MQLLLPRAFRGARVALTVATRFTEATALMSSPRRAAEERLASGWARRGHTARPERPGRLTLLRKADATGAVTACIVGAPV